MLVQFIFQLFFSWKAAHDASRIAFSPLNEIAKKTLSEKKGGKKNKNNDLFTWLLLNLACLVIFYKMKKTSPRL